MTERSLRASQDGIKKAKLAVKSQGWTQRQIGEQVGTTRQPVGKFLRGQPIERPTFIDICCLLGLNWEETAEPDPSDENQKNSIDIDALVQEVREKIQPSIQERCGTMRVLDMTQPIGLNDIYTNVNILEKITGRRRKEIAELLQDCNSEDFDRFGVGRVTEERVPGLDAVQKYNKLMILGKPGAGKTTFLKHIAIQCNAGEFQANRVPIFVTLKDFAEDANQPTLLKYIRQQFSGCGDVETLHTTSLHEVINRGRALFLLDGLDEVREEDNSRVLKEICGLSTQFRDNQFAITCRIAAREYTFDKFTEVEISDFDDEQIATFAHNWFKSKAVKTETFIKSLQDNKPIQELATNPLLLTLLCLVFEGSGDFPANRSELYKEGLDALLKKWDAKRGIYRDQVYKKLSVQRKEELLSKIALSTFEQSNYFFKQKVAAQYITDYIRNLPDANTEPEALQLDSEQILQSIEAQHGLLVERAKGVYSFSHLTFHEYFTAREIVVVKQSSEEALQNLVSHITETRWREVFLLAVEMLPSADRLLLLMKERVDALVAADEKLQQFLSWANQKSLCLQLPCMEVRAFYLCLEDADTFRDRLFIDNSLDFAYALGLEHLESYVVQCEDASLLQNGLGLDLALYETLDIGLSYAFSPENALADGLENVLNNHELEPELKHSLHQLKDELPDPNKDKEGFNKWWEANGESWAKKLSSAMINYRNIGYKWSFTYEQEEALAHYYEATWLLMDCLNSGRQDVSREVRYEIEDTLLLPIAESEQRKERYV